MSKKKTEEEKKAEEEWKLYDHIETESVIQCDCGFSDSINDDSTDAMTVFYEEGWRVARTKVYCPRCVKNKLKEKTQTK